MKLCEILKQIQPLSTEKMEMAQKRWNSIAKPLHSLGKMEDLIVQIVGITGDLNADISKKALFFLNRFQSIGRPLGCGLQKGKNTAEESFLFQ